MGSHRSTQMDSDWEDDGVIPTTAFLKTSKGIQSAVDRRLQQLASLNEQGMFRSQRGGQDQIAVKHKIPWPQNHILAGTSKNRVTYDSLSTFQWVSGFCTIIKDESNVATKKAMLEYMSELMEDAQDFGWASAKGAHAVLLCRMEEGKVNWKMTERIDRIRRAHAQKIVNNPAKKSNSDTPVNSTRIKNAHTKWIIKLQANFTSTYVASVAHWENVSLTHSKIAEIQKKWQMIQKTNEALQ